MIRILLVDDQSIICQAMQALLGQEPDFEVVGTANDGQTAIEQALRLKPDLLLCDIEMPGMSGIAATRVICRRLPQTKVIVLSSHAEEAYLTNALRAGAKGYLLKNTVAQDLINTIRSVHRGYSQLGPGLFEKIVARVTNPHRNAKPTVDFGKLGLSETKLLLLLEHFDRDTLPQVVDTAIDQDLVEPLLTYLNHHLEDYPTALAALYWCGALSRSVEQSSAISGMPQAIGVGRSPVGDHRDSESAWLYLKLGFQEGIRQGLLPEGLLLFYREAVHLQPEAAFAWLMQAESPWSQADGLTFLLAEAQRQFGATSAVYRSLLLLKQIRAVHNLSHACMTLQPNLNALQTGFGRLDRGTLPQPDSSFTPQTLS